MGYSLIMNPLNFQVRAADADDSSKLSEVAVNTFRQTYEGMITSGDLESYIRTSFSVKKMETELQRQDLRVFVAETSDGIVGYCKTQLGSAPSCVPGHKPAELVRSYIDKKAQGLGIGRAFFSSSKAWALKQNCDGLWLSVWSKNLRGIGFHQKMGFVQVGEQDFVVGSDVLRDLVMYQPL